MGDMADLAEDDGLVQENDEEDEDRDDEEDCEEGEEDEDEGPNYDKESE